MADSLAWPRRAACCNVRRVSPGRHNGSGDRRRSCISIRVCAKQALANSLFNERERFLGLSRFGFSKFGTKLYGRQLILLSFKTRVRLFQRSTRILQLAFGVDDEFALRPLGSFRSHFGKPQSFQGIRAKRLGAGFGLASVLLHAAEDIGRLMHQIEGRCSRLWGRRWGKAQDVLLPCN